METLYENVKHDDLNMPATVSFPAEKAEKIVGLLKDADVKCIINSDENKTAITFSIDDIEKLNKLLQPIGIEKQLNNSAIQLHNIEKKENLIPIANAFSKLYDRKINGRNSRIEAHQKHIGTLSNALNQQKNSIQTLKDRNVMLAKFSEIFTAFKNPINALITRNERKIDRLINNNIPKLEKQIQAHNTTIDKLNKSAEHYMVKKNACNHLSEVIKSFIISRTNERNQNYLIALSSLNGDIQQINTDRIKNCIDTIAKLETNFSELTPIKQQKVQERISNLIKTQNSLAERNKVLQAAQPDISAMLARLNDNSVTEKIDMAAIIFDQKISQSNSMYFDSVMTSAAMENSCAVSQTAAEIVQTEVNVISNVNDKDGDMIPDRLDSTFDPKAAENNESPNVKEQNPASDVQENQSEDTQAQEIPNEYDNSFDEMLKKNKDQIPPLYDDYMPEPPPENNMSETSPNVPLDHTDKKSDTRIYLVTENELESLKKSGIKLKVNNKHIQEDGKIPVLINAKDNGKYKKIINDLKKLNENKVVNKK